MKRLMAMLLVLTMVLGLSMTAMAEDTTYEDVSSITITKVFKDANGGKSPAETFSFTDLTCESVTDAVAGVTKDNAPIPTIGTVEFTEGEATSAGKEKTATITLPTYTSVGIYTYKFNEVAGTTAGVTYNNTDLYLVVSVVEQNGKIRVAAVHCEGSHDAGEYGVSPKTDKFTNTYESGKLQVSKTVTGNMGDVDKYFDVTVTFTAPSGETINSTITYTGGQYTQDVTVTNNTATIQVKNGDTVTFSNIPEGVTYTVVEADYTEEANGGYEAAAYEFSDSEKKIAAGDTDTCAIENKKDATIDTGISMDSLPYIVIIALVAAAAAAFFMRRRRSGDE